MISPISRTKGWIDQHRNDLDPELAEKMILSFCLVESLQNSGLKFIFKGGTSLPLLTGRVSRFSIDVDIIISPGTNLNPYFLHIIHQGVFSRYEEDIRNIDLPVKHFRFIYNDISKNEKHIFVDALFEENPYPSTHFIPVISPILNIEGTPTKVLCPTLEGLLGDKLTAYAPHTTGVQFNKKKDLEIAKQLFDIATLFDYATKTKGSLSRVFEAYTSVVTKELVYRKLGSISSKDVLMDSFQTSCMIGTYGKLGDQKEFNEIETGSNKLKSYVYSGKFSLESGILCAAKAACLVAAGITKVPDIRIFNSDNYDATRLIKNITYNKLNKTRGLGPETFFYFCQGLDLLGLFY